MVSIHASAWEATRRPRPEPPNGRVSIHASAWEATGPGDEAEPAAAVSIHASAWEATTSSTSPAEVPMFQSTPPHGRRRAGICRAGCRRCFNPRLRMGGDRTAAGPAWTPRSFNPRLRMGGDPARPSTTARGAPFQSTPPHGRRRCAGTCPRSLSWFQSTPPHGRRPALGYVHIMVPEFQSTPPHGRRPWISTNRATCSSFNPRLRMGGDWPSPSRRSWRCVSIHASAWEATRC